MIPALQKDEDLKNNILSTKNKVGGLRLWWLGQSGFLVQWHGTHILFDPYLSDSLTTKYANSDKPHERLSEKCINPDLLDMIDLVTSSHNHTDHLDAFTLKPLFSVNPNLVFIIPEANRDFVVNRCQISTNMPVGLVNNQAYHLNEKVSIQAIPAAHNELTTDEQGRHKFLGFILRMGKYTLYHSGDTLWYDELEEILKEHQPTISFLPINGNKPERRVAGNLNYKEAAELGKRIDTLVIPHHYDMFAFNTEDPDNFVRACEEKGTRYQVMRIGEGMEF